MTDLNASAGMLADRPATDLEDDLDERWHDHLWPDYNLRVLAELTYQTGVGMPVTLTVAGQTITGKLISPSTFFRSAAGQVAATPSGEVVKPLVDHWNEECARVDSEATGQLDPEREDRPFFINLQDVRVLSGGQWVSIPDWRGRLIDVSGWSFGSPS